MKLGKSIGKIEAFSVAFPLFFFVPQVVSAADPTPEEEGSGLPMIVFVQRLEGSDEMQTALYDLQAGVSDLGVATDEVWLREDCDEEKATGVALEKGATAVFWFEDREAERNLFFFRPMDRGHNIQMRSIDKANKKALALAQMEILRGWVGAMVLFEKEKDNPSTEAIPMVEEDIHPEPSAVVEIAEKATSVKETAQDSPSPIVEVERQRDWVTLEGAYNLTVQSEEHPAVHGVELLIGVHIIPELLLFAGYLFALPTEYESPEVFMRLSRHPLLVGGGFAHEMGRFEIGAEVAFSLDYVTQSVVSSRESVSVTDEDGVFQIAIVPMLKSRVHVVESFCFFVAVGAEIYVYQQRYLTDVDDETKELHLAWPVQPSLLAGASVGF